MDIFPLTLGGPMVVTLLHRLCMRGIASMIYLTMYILILTGILWQYLMGSPWRQQALYFVLG